MEFGRGVFADTLPMLMIRQKVRRIGVLLAATSDDLEFQAWVGACCVVSRSLFLLQEELRPPVISSGASSAAKGLSEVALH
jgi:hypothetical protein